MQRTLSTTRALVALVLGALAAVALAAPAGAHVSPSPSSAPAGGYATIEFQVPHGCDGAPTEEVAIALTEELASVKAEAVPGWTVHYEKAERSAPVELHGKPVSDYVRTVTWTADGAPLADDQYQRFGLSLKLPETEGGSMLFPTVQRCEGGVELAWISEDEEAEHPAPRITLTAAADGHAEPSTATTVAAATPVAVGAADATSSTETGDDALARALSVVAVVLAAAAVVLALRVRRPA